MHRIIQIMDINEDEISPGLIGRFSLKDEHAFLVGPSAKNHWHVFLPVVLDNDTGAVNVTVYYSAILIRPFRNEVLDAVVIAANDEVSLWMSRRPHPYLAPPYCDTEIGL
jgi:hypothetical protein